MSAGKCFVLAGGDGSGKSTQLRLLRERMGEQTLFTREPGGSERGEAIRTLLLSDTLEHAPTLAHFYLFWAARADHIASHIRPALEAGRTVISDRFDCCTYAYQVNGRANPALEKHFWETRVAVLGNWSPDRYLFLDMTPEDALRRIEGRATEEKNFLDRRTLDFHERVRDAYHAFFGQLPASQVAIIDANRTPEEVLASLIAAMK